MAIWLEEALFRDVAGPDGKLVRRMDGVYSIDLKTGKLGLPTGIDSVIYAPSDVKKLARAQKLSYVDCANRYFRRVGVDDSKGAYFFVAKDDEERKKG